MTPDPVREALAELIRLNEQQNPEATPQELINAWEAARASISHQPVAEPTARLVQDAAAWLKRAGFHYQEEQLADRISAGLAQFARLEAAAQSAIAALTFAARATQYADWRSKYTTALEALTAALSPAQQEKKE